MKSTIHLTLECSSIAHLNSNTRFDILDNEFTQPNVNNVIDEVELPFESTRVQKEHFIQDSYLDEISQPLPEGTRIFSPSTSASSSSNNPTVLSAIFRQVAYASVLNFVAQFT